MDMSCIYTVYVIMDTNTKHELSVDKPGKYNSY